MRQTFRDPQYVIHDIMLEWEQEYGYDIPAEDRLILAQRIVRGLGDEYGTTRIYNDHYSLIPAIGPTLGAA
jgi:hypothetical protein